MKNDIITTDAQTFAQDSGLVELYELELSDTVTLFFYPGLEGGTDEVQFHPIGQPTANTTASANTYSALPMMMEGIELTGTGANNRPTITIANVLSVFRAAIQAQSFQYDDLIGKVITRRTTFGKYLVGGDSEGVPEEFPIRRYYIDRIAQENRLSIQFELASPFDVENIKLPSRTVVGKYCSWEYQGFAKGRGACFWQEDNELTYTGSNGSSERTVIAHFDVDDRYIALESAVNTVTLGAWQSGTPYSKNKYVQHLGKHWLSISDNNSSTPTGNATFWKEVRVYTVYASTGVNYAINDLVEHEDKIWIKHKGSATENPIPGEDGGVIWQRIDFCGKTLQSCKARFHARINPLHETSSSLRTLVGAIESEATLLPFGGFPGSVKFK
jgi:lambda family phage minor tail protein L